jgi:hypothetical protein
LLFHKSDEERKVGLHELALHFILGLLNYLLLLKLLLLEIKGNDGRQLQRISNCYQLSAIKARNWQEALRLKHLRTLIQNDNLELHPFQDLKTSGRASSPDYSLLVKDGNPILD